MDVWIANMRDNRNEWTSCKEMTEAGLECEEPTSADMKVCQETTAYHEATEADTEKTEHNPGIMQSIEDHQEVPKEDTAVMPDGGLRKWHRDWNLATGHRQSQREGPRQVVNPGGD
jgi:hypothetical protein